MRLATRAELRPVLFFYLFVLFAIEKCLCKYSYLYFYSNTIYAVYVALIIFVNKIIIVQKMRYLVA